jgi:selenocysteine lyase/cysteine desulfurase
MKGALTTARFNASRFFDCGGLAYVPRRFRERAYASAPPRDSWEQLLHGVRELVAPLFAPTNGDEPRYSERHVALFHNTTSALQRILMRIDREFAGSDPTLLTTDQEFPGCVAAIDDCWSGPVVVAKAGPLHESLAAAYNYVKPRVVFLSHVARAAGQVVARETLQYFREANPRVVIVLDGSQALGNTVVGDDVLELVDFYVACGHKWLGGLTTSGFVWQKEPDVWRLPDPGQSVSPVGHQAGTGVVSAWASLYDSIDDMTQRSGGRPLAKRLAEVAEHNRAVARRFCRRLERLRPLVEPVATPASGLTAIRARGSVGARVTAELQKRRIAFTLLNGDSVCWALPTGAGSRYRISRLRAADGPLVEAVSDTTDVGTSPDLMRFCFHYYHSERHADELANLISRAAAA